MTQDESLWREKASLFRSKFGCREDLFGVKYFYNFPTKNTNGTTTWEQKGIYHPHCDNYGNPKLCLITRRDGSCTSCSNKQYGTLTDEWLYKHITGEKELVLYLLQEGGIKFGAVDFDKLDPFHDALLIKNYLEKLGIKSYIARSTKKGYHLYTFFSALVPAHHYTSLIRKCFQDLGIYQRAQESGDFYIPEVFPKQVSFSPSSIGNGIKPPMIQTRFEEGFNCWVNDDATPVKADEQWAYLKTTADITPELLSETLAKWEIEVIEAPVARGKGAASRETGGRRPENTEKWEVATTGDFNKVVTKCAALRQFWEKDDKGQYKFDSGANENGVPHMARVASLALAIRTKNGVDIIRERWPSARCETEISYAIKANQHPWSCSAMQAQGLCRVGQHPQHHDHCFQKKQPMERISGVWVPQDIPETEWPSPSPIRFSSEGETKRTPEELIEEIVKIQSSKEPQDVIDDKIQSIIKMKITYSLEDQRKIDKYLKKNDVLSQPQITELTNRAKRERSEEKIAEAREEHPSFRHGDSEYIIKDGGYLKLTVGAKGGIKETPLSNFTVVYGSEIEKVKAIEEINKDTKTSTETRYLDGYILIANQKKWFSTTTAWLKNYESLAELLYREGGTGIDIERQNFADLVRCINRFGSLESVKKKRLSEIGHVWYNDKDTYFMPSTVVTKDGPQMADEFDVKLEDDYGQQYDFIVLGEDQFKEVAKHILQDYFNANSRIAAMTSFAHAMAASIMNLIPLSRNPILWLMGNQGSGKSYLAHNTQFFFGNFKFIVALSSTWRSMLAKSSILKDVLLVLDDYKKHTIQDSKGFMQFLQNSYDGSGRGRLNKDGSSKDTLRSKGLLLVTGEEPTEDESSTIARMMIVDCEPKQDTVLGERVTEMRHLYCGFTPQFIHYAYNLEHSWIKQVYSEYTDFFNNDVKAEYENTLRVSQNLAHNMTAFRFVMDMLVLKGVIDVTVKDAYLAEHMKNLKIIRSTVLNHVHSQKGSEVFLNGLRDLLANGKRYYIDGADEDISKMEEHRNAQMLGFCRAGNPDVVYIVPNLAHAEVSSMLNKSSNKTQSKSIIGRLLYADGHIPPGMFDGKKQSIYTKQVNGPNGIRYHAWVIKRESLGMRTPMQNLNAAPPPVVVPVRSEDADDCDDDLVDQMKGSLK